MNGLPAAVNEKRSVTGMDLPAAITLPISRCHQKSSTGTGNRNVFQISTNTGRPSQRCSIVSAIFLGVWLSNILREFTPGTRIFCSGFQRNPVLDPTMVTRKAIDQDNSDQRVSSSLGPPAELDRTEHGCSSVLAN